MLIHVTSKEGIPAEVVRLKVKLTAKNRHDTTPIVTFYLNGETNTRAQRTSGAQQHSPVARG